MRASVPPLSGVFQQGGTRRAKRLTSCPMYAPAIPAHYKGGGLYFLRIFKLAISNCLAEKCRLIHKPPPCTPPQRRPQGWQFRFLFLSQALGPLLFYIPVSLL